MQKVLKESGEKLERRYRYQAEGYDLDWLTDQVALKLEVECDIVIRRGRYPETVEARSVLCFWASRGLGISALDLSKRFGILQATASQSVKLGEKTVIEKRLKLLE